MKFLAITSLFAAAAVAADIATYGQCGGANFKSNSKCKSSDTCKYSNEWYSQCVPKSSGSPTTSGATTTLTPSKPGPSDGEIPTYVDISVWYAENTETIVGTEDDGSQLAVVVAKEYPIYVDESALTTDNIDVKYAHAEDNTFFAVVFAA